METITMTLTLDEMNLVLKGLGELPARESIMLIQNIHSYYNKQKQEKANPVKQKLQEVTFPAGDA